MTDLASHGGAEDREGAGRQGSRAALVVGLETAALVALTAVWAVPRVFGGSPAPRAAVGASAALLGALLATLLSIRAIRALAWHTFAQCVRMKVAAVFALLLAASLAVLPLIMKGDGTQAGAIRTLLAYGTSITALLLSIVTVLLAAAVVTSDVRQKRIFITATKPLPRWQYVLGRWLGVVALDALLLALAMAAVYVAAQYLRRQGPGAGGEDRRVVQTEVFAARVRVPPEPQDLQRAIDDRVNYLKQEGIYPDALAAWRSRTGGDEALAEQELLREIEKDVREARNSVGPGGGLMWRFSRIRTAGREIRGSGGVQEVLLERNQLRLGLSPSLMNRVLHNSPVRVNDIDGRIAEIGSDAILVQFYGDAVYRLGPNILGRAVEVVLDPTIQVTYKAVTTGSGLELQTAASGEQVRLLTSEWEVENPQTHARHLERRRDPTERPATLTVSARAVSDQGNVTVRFTNLSPASVKIAPADISVLYPLGRFEWNFARAVLLMLLQLAFLAGVGVFAGCFLSFQVAVLLCLTVLPFSMARSYLAESVRVSSLTAPGLDAITILGNVVVRLMAVLLPDFASTWPSDSLVDGLRISWGYVGETAALTMGIRTVAILALGCLIFRSRELARVQV